MQNGIWGMAAGEKIKNEDLGGKIKKGEKRKKLYKKTRGKGL